MDRVKNRSVMVRVPEPVFQAAQQQAEREDRSVAWVMRRLIQQAMERQEEPQHAA